MFSFAIFLSLFLSRTVLAVPVDTVAHNLNVISSIELAPTALDRLRALPNPVDHVFDFKNPPVNATTTGKGSIHCF